jgi:hypothetical protein
MRFSPWIGFALLTVVVHCVGDSTTIPTPDGGTDATTSDATSDGALNDAATSDVAAEAGSPQTGAFASNLVLPDTTTGAAVVVATNGDTLVGGSLYDLDNPVTINGGGFNSKGDNDVLVYKVAENDGFKWAVSFGDTGQDWAYAVAMDSNGDAYVAGTVDCAAASGSISVDNLHSVACKHAGSESYVVKLGGTDGTVKWVDSFDTVSGGNNDCAALATNPQTGTITVACSMEGNMTYVDMSSTQQTVTHTGGQDDVFLAELDPATGHVEKSAYLPGAGNDVPTRLVYDAAGDLYVVGYSSSQSIPVLVPSTATNAEFTVTLPTSFGCGWVAKLASADWSHAWDRSYGAGSKATFLSGAAVDSTGNVYLAGTFSGTVDFGLGGITAAGAPDVVLFELSSSAAATNVTQLGANNLGMSMPHVTVDSANHVVVAGVYEGAGLNLTFGSTQLPTSTGSAFVSYTAKLSSDLKTFLWAQGNGSNATAAQNGVQIVDVAFDPSTQGIATTGTLFAASADFGDGKQIARTVEGSFLLRRAP